MYIFRMIAQITDSYFFAGLVRVILWGLLQFKNILDASANFHGSVLHLQLEHFYFRVIL